MIQLSGITKQFGDQTLYRNLDMTFGTNEVVGLMGDNGSGKTTFLQMIAGLVVPDTGTINTTGETIGYLPQQPHFPTGQSIETFLSGYVTDSNEAYRIDMALVQVGMDHVDQSLQPETLSGGQQTRLFLATLLLQDPEPTVLLLDEPTNNLDITGIEWLEGFILGFPGTVLLTSHDRALLDNVVDRIVELENGILTSYGGSYSFALEQKQIEREAYERRFVVQQKKIHQIEEDIERMKQRAFHGEEKFSSRAPGVRRKIRKSAQQAVSRQKKLEKFLASEKRLEKPEERLNHSIRLDDKAHPGKTMLYLQNVTKAFGGNLVLRDVSLHLGGSERVWLAGLNGSGKTTLLRIIAGEEIPDSGSVERGANISIGYFSQHRSDLISSNTILDELARLGLTRTEAYEAAIRFGFKPDEVSHTIATLSSGQQMKVSFAKLVARNHQLLILDEPTNHLEIRTRELLENALSLYRGALLVSSHDRYFLERIGITRILTLPAPAATASAAAA